MSQAVTTRALLAETRIDDPREATIAMRDELLDAADAIITFFEYLTIAMAEKHDLFFDSPRQIKVTGHLPSATEVRIPPLCRDRGPSGAKRA